MELKELIAVTDFWEDLDIVVKELDDGYQVDGYQGKTYHIPTLFKERYGHEDVEYIGRNDIKSHIEIHIFTTKEDTQ